MGLWIAGAFVLALAAAPSLFARWAVASNRNVTAPGKLAQSVIEVRGMDCEACAAPISAALAKVGGFYDLRLDIAAQRATVRYEPAPARLDAYVAAINDLGYDAALQPTGRQRRE
ncbi:heavy-metal-associated domain-containing protein [Pendulispora brunnea]|uniref:Heavy-metal-associated domain-containing protein n=1 Tax=Pendulispora brunnea TaxID=2905690 RepID=A0ABZ2KAB6_9BACT